MGESDWRTMYQRDFDKLTGILKDAEPLFLMRQLGLTKSGIAKRCGLSLLRVNRLLDIRSETIIGLEKLDAVAARRDINWPYNPANNPAI